MKRLTILILLLLLAGCENPGPRFRINNELYAKNFQECLKLVPQGPVQTKYNDWNEVVKACDSAAWSQSRICYANCQNVRAY